MIVSSLQGLARTSDVLSTDYDRGPVEHIEVTEPVHSWREVDEASTVGFTHLSFEVDNDQGDSIVASAHDHTRWTIGTDNFVDCGGGAYNIGTEATMCATRSGRIEILKTADPTPRKLGDGSCWQASRAPFSG